MLKYIYTWYLPRTLGPREIPPGPTGPRPNPPRTAQNLQKPPKTPLKSINRLQNTTLRGVPFLDWVLHLDLTRFHMKSESKSSI